MTLARQMFFISLLYDAEFTEVSEKAQMFLEILGNTQLRPKTFQVIYDSNIYCSPCDLIINFPNP